MAPFLFIALLIVISFLIAVLFGLRKRSIMGFLVLGVVVRVLTMFLDHFGIFSVPGSAADSQAFVSHAQYLTDLPWGSMQQLYDPTHAFNGYAFYGALVMRVIGFHSLVMPAMNLVAGAILLGVTGATIFQMWGAKAAKIGTFILAVYPFAVFNSAIALREEFSIAAFSIGLYFALRWIRTGSWSKLIFSIMFLGIATSIHPGFVGAFVGLSAYMSIFLFRTTFQMLRDGTATMPQVFKSLTGVVLLSFVLVIITIGGGISLGKGIVVGGEDDTEVAELIESRFQRESRGGSAYPAAISSGNPFSQPWLIPARMVYFHFSPFIWDIRSPRHILGLISSILYFFLAFRIFKGWKQLKGREETLLLLLMLGSLTFVFAVGVTNIGTAIRHKTKLLGLILIIAASSFTSLRSKFRVR